MNRSTSIGAGLSTAAAMLFLAMVAASAQQAPQYPLDDKLANEPAPWTVPGKWGKHGNWGRWGEDDKRGMLNYITPEMVVQAAALDDHLDRKSTRLNSSHSGESRMPSSA